MNKYLWPALIITAILVVAAVSYFFGYDNGSEQTTNTPAPTPVPQAETPTQTPENFYSGGTILKQGNDVYLEYTQGSTPGRTKLVITDQAECLRLRQTVACKDLDLKTGEIVTVNGERTAEEIVASSIFVTVPQPVPNTSGVFQESPTYGYYGTLTLNGYMQVEKRVCNPGDMCGETVDYAYFVFNDTPSAALMKFLGYQQGNSFAGKNKIGIGCVQADKSRVYYENDADLGYITGSINGADYTKLAAATESKPVQIKMTREVYTGGRGAPDCYSHFRNFDVL